MKKYMNKNGQELKESLQEMAERLEAQGFTIEVFNAGGAVRAYRAEDVKFEEYIGSPHLNGCAIWVQEVYRSNGTEKNVNIDLQVYKYERSSGCIQGRNEKKIRFRMDASEKVKNARLEAILERYNRFK
jgi:hypothetical protein